MKQIPDKQLNEVKPLTPIAEWCECGDYMENDIFSNDFMCRCGVEKHHYHCGTCKKITQIG
jgi:hypothetical protein